MPSGRWFASDNNASVHPEIMAALIKANAGHAVGYGDDPITKDAEKKTAALFGKGAEVRFVMNGTGANVYALACFAGHGEAVLCSDCAHILVDETGAPTALTGAQLVPVSTRAGKIVVSALLETIRTYNDMHKPKPAVVSISQPTELGTLYSASELQALCAAAHEHGLFVHVDGARLSNAAAAMRCDLAAASGYSAGADVVCFGGTKNGLMFGEAVVFAPAADSTDRLRLRKTHVQLASKMRFIAAQFSAYAKNNLWKKNAANANAMAAKLCDALIARGIEPEYACETNALFIKLPPAVRDDIREKHFFYDWEDGAVRWMASWDTTQDDVDALLNDVDKAVERHGLRGALVSEETLGELLDNGRRFLKSNWDMEARIQSPEQKGAAAPPFTSMQNPLRTFALPQPDLTLSSKTFSEITATRRSRRRYTEKPVTLAELSFLLWASAGIKSVKGVNAFRTVPSGGCRHPFDMLLYVRRVSGLKSGIYRYLPLTHELALVKKAKLLVGADTDKLGFLDCDAAMDEALSGQLWNAALMCMWSALPYRTEWRYTVAAAKTIALDAGHSCQALYGACEALSLGTCAQAAYNQLKLDAALGLDGSDEFIVYAASVGHVAR